MTETVFHIDRQGDGIADLALAGQLRDLYQPLVVAGVDRDLANREPAQHQRLELAEALGEANRKWSHPRAAELAQKLATPDTKVVVTGQQPGIFGGPFYTLVKALTATLVAERLEREGHPAVAVFWIAGEDHDFREVSATAWLQDGQLRQETLGEDERPLLPVGARRFGPPVESLVREWKQVSQSENWLREADRLSRIYQSQATFSSAFAAYLVDVLGEKCPLLLDSQNQTVKRLQRPHLKKLIENRETITERFAEREQQILARGLVPQIRTRSGAAPLFVHQDGLRRRVLWRDGGFAVDDSSPARPVEDLLSLLEQAPEAVSPSALSRPVIQDALLGTSLSVVGPGEMAYMAQVAPLYGLLEVDAPGLAMRPSVAIAPKRKLTQLADVDFPLEVLLAGEERLESTLALRSGTNPVVDAKSQIEVTLDQLHEPLSGLQSDLAVALDKTKGGVVKALERLEGRVNRELAQLDETTATRARDVQQLLMPGGQPQERSLSTAFLLGRFGSDLPHRLSQVLDLEPGRMQLIAI